MKPSGTMDGSILGQKVAGREDRQLEEPKRLAPTTDVTRDLYLRSGNRCAYPDCNQPLMRSDGVLVGEIAHIEAAMRANMPLSGS